MAFLILRTHDLFAVDGAVRAFFVFHDGHASFAGTNHMLYPVWIFVWTRTLGHFGFDVSTPVSFIQTAQAMNGFFAAGTGTSLFVAATLLKIRSSAAVVASIGWSFSYAVLLHATNSAEPMAGMLFASVAWAVVVWACVNSRKWYWFIVPGLLLALAMASYQAMVFMGLGCVVTSFSWVDGENWDPRRGFARTCAISAAFIIGLLGIYGTAYYLQGIRDFHAGLHAFLTSPGRDVYGHFSLSRVMNLSSGFVGNVVRSLPTGFAGYRSLFHNYAAWIPWFATISVLLLGICVLQLRAVVGHWRKLPDPAKAAISGCVATLLLWIVLLCYWDPNYSKFWIQPIWSLFMIGIVIFKFSNSRFMAVLSGLVVALIVIVDCTAAISATRKTWEDLDEASRVQQFVAKNDTVVIGWEPVSILYRTIWAPETTFDFPARMCVQRGAVESLLNEMQTSTQERHGRVFFLGVLDMPKSTWEPFLGNRCGVAYSALDKYRQRAEVVEKFRSGSGETILYSIPQQ